MELMAHVGTSYLMSGRKQPLGPGAWHHVALVFDAAAGEARFYFDGEPEGPAIPVAGPPRHDPGPLRIGNEGINDPYEGDLDEVRVLRRALPAAWIRLAYRTERPGAAVLARGPVARR